MIQRTAIIIGAGPAGLTAALELLRRSGKTPEGAPAIRPIVLERANDRVGIVLCHGYLSAPEEVRELAEHLHHLGFALHCPRLPGHGTRWQDANMTTWDDWYSCVEREFFALRERCDQVFVMGLSMGGGQALQIGLTHLDLFSYIGSFSGAIRNFDKNIVVYRG